jgi:hypothetical protein
MDSAGLFSHPDRHEAAQALSPEPVKSPAFSDNGSSAPDPHSS